jgi:hypothetical protein
MTTSNSPRSELAASIAKAPEASFDVSRSDSALIRSIVARAFRDAVLRPCLHFIEDEADARTTLSMDIEAVHANGNPLNLAKLLDVDDFTFRHDISGIQGNVDRRSGRLRNFFTPRTSLSAAENEAIAARRPDAAGAVTNLLGAAEHAGAARVHLENAKSARNQVPAREAAAKRSTRRNRTTAKKAAAAKRSTTPSRKTTAKSSRRPRR